MITETKNETRNEKTGQLNRWCKAFKTCTLKHENVCGETFNCTLNSVNYNLLGRS